MHIRNRVMAITFWALVITQVVILVVSVFVTFSAAAASNLTLFVLVTSLGAVPLLLDHE